MKITSRYEGINIDENTMCEGYCDGMGFYPHESYYKCLFINEPTEDEATEQLDWDKAHIKRIIKTFGIHYFTCDGWHFLKCRKCNGSGLKDNK